MPRKMPRKKLNSKRSTPDEQKVDAAAGERLRRLRIARGLSQTALGEKVGISFQQIQKYEKGNNRISVSRLFAFANALEVEPIDILPMDMIDAVPVAGKAKKAGRKPKTSEESTSVVSDAALRLAFAYDALPNGEFKKGIRSLVTSYTGDGS